MGTRLLRILAALAFAAAIVSSPARAETDLKLVPQPALPSLDRLGFGPETEALPLSAEAEFLRGKPGRLTLFNGEAMPKGAYRDKQGRTAEGPWMAGGAHPAIISVVSPEGCGTVCLMDAVYLRDPTERGFPAAVRPALIVLSDDIDPSGWPYYAAFATKGRALESFLKAKGLTNSPLTLMVDEKGGLIAAYEGTLNDRAMARLAAAKIFAGVGPLRAQVQGLAWSPSQMTLADALLLNSRRSGPPDAAAAPQTLTAPAGFIQTLQTLGRESQARRRELGGRIDVDPASRKLSITIFTNSNNRMTAVVGLSARVGLHTHPFPSFFSPQDTLTTFGEGRANLMADPAGNVYLALPTESEAGIPDRILCDMCLSFVRPDCPVLASLGGDRAQLFARTVGEKTSVALYRWDGTVLRKLPDLHARFANIFTLNRTELTNVLPWEQLLITAVSKRLRKQSVDGPDLDWPKAMSEWAAANRIPARSARTVNALVFLLLQAQEPKAGIWAMGLPQLVFLDPFNESASRFRVATVFGPFCSELGEPGDLYTAGFALGTLDFTSNKLINTRQWAVRLDGRIEEMEPTDAAISFTDRAGLPRRLVPRGLELPQ